MAAQRGRSEFIMHISRLADIENRGVIPSLHKIYTLAVIYHLNPLDIFRWYEVPMAPPMAPMTMARMIARKMLNTALRWASFCISFV